MELVDMHTFDHCRFWLDTQNLPQIASFHQGVMVLDIETKSAGMKVSLLKLAVQDTDAYQCNSF